MTIKRSAILIVLVVSLASCSNRQTGEVSVKEDLIAKQLLQGIWVNDETEMPLMRIEGDTVYYANPQSAPVPFKVVHDTIYISVSYTHLADKAGLNVLFVPSEEPYHERKVTLLNGPHTVLSPVAYLSEVNIVRDACQHPIIGQYIHKVMFDELMETLNLPKNELKKFAEDVLERFNNPFVDHAVTSIMLNSFPKYQTRDLPGLKTYLKRKGELPKGLVLGLAAIITYYKGGTRADGTEIIPNDAPEIMQLLKDLWATGDTRKVAEGVLAAKDLIWGEHGDLNTVPGLTDMITCFLKSIQEKGIQETVKGIP